MAQRPQASRREKRSETSIEDAVRPARHASGRAWLSESPSPPAGAAARLGRGYALDRNRYGRDNARWPAAAWVACSVNLMNAGRYCAPFRNDWQGWFTSPLQLARSGCPRLRVAGVAVREQVRKNDGQNAG